MENEIKVNEFVRTKEGYIGKLVEYIPNALNYLKIDVGREITHCDNSKDNFIYTRYGFQLKHSPNLIDLIQCGDYVNGKEVIEVLSDSVLVLTYNIKSADNIDQIYINQIKKILTHEQFESISYKVTKM